MSQVGFVGLGVMGGAMARHLASKADLTVWNRTLAKADEFTGLGCRVASTLEALAATSPVIILCVNRTEDVRACIERAVTTAQPNTLFVDHSTISPDGAIEIHSWLQTLGHRFVDAPITGGSMGARNGQLTVFCGGSPEDIAEAQRFIESYSKRVERVGGPGAGQQMKMANQIAVGGALIGLCECLAFAAKAGLDLAQARELIGGGAAGSWAFENYGPKILNHDWTPGFSVTNQRKDFQYCREAAESIGAQIPGTDLVDRLLHQLELEGHGDWTTAALFDVLMKQ